MPGNESDLEKAIALHKQGNLKGAETIYRQLLSQRSDDQELLTLLGTLLFQASRYREAAEMFQKALSLSPDSLSLMNNLSLSLIETNELDKARKILKQMLKIAPDHVAAYNLLGSIAIKKKDYGEAIELSGKALSLKPNFAEALNNLGAAFKEKRSLKRSEHYFRLAIGSRPNYPEALKNLAAVLNELGRPEKAKKYLLQAIAIKPDYVNALVALAALFIAGEDPDEAEKYLKDAVAINENNHEVLNGLGAFHQNKGQLVEAEKYFRRAHTLKPGDPGTLSNLGAVLMEQKRISEAEKCFKQALSLEPGHSDALNGLGGIAAVYKNNFQSAESLFLKAIKYRPANNAALRNLANMYSDYGLFKKAMVYYKRSLAVKPDSAETHMALGFMLLGRGDFRRGWKEYEWRLKVKRLAHNYLISCPVPFWDGSIAKQSSILVSAEQGLGDTIQFIRYMRMVRQKVGRVIFQCSGSLVSLLHDCPGIDKLIDWSDQDGLKREKIDLQISLLSLPGIFKTDRHTIPADIPYINADPGLREKWADIIAPTNAVKIGLVWAGNPAHANDLNRSITLSKLLPMLKIKGIKWFSLQKGEAAKQLSTLPTKALITDLAGKLIDFSETAAAIANLDLVVSVDTAVAHLTGALGKPLWLLLPFNPEWRWRLPWYPTARLFKQNKRGDWTGVIRRVMKELQVIRAKGDIIHAGKR
ncbi:hypothetical protein A2625_07605 [candidate division WOR-1 bacterium RIFCSPHIGHO2_01_FULL_53_15]|uniref:Cytochrome c-type biogenesis protein H TPR domain-containing protein n=1 Tax=candidate division WOR-1 bacterium RIFCSPHIGHO2_01_FULL_53_15 TaxID=1802564 RepID=A0A1F4Q4K0_UNCSA|nr:MAG: hypothetical protein A2625_07605 [candidate division WOR-1 bacterium RIFCSPHIGHO2_01_FULL_53_15]OGC10561.1 MAG: hypothetical protein A3D23_01560 [candidate division WOR-1 bacterium RIFCSPHIGHO2_02_FULL_53_26]